MGRQLSLVVVGVIGCSSHAATTPPAADAAPDAPADGPVLPTTGFFVAPGGDDSAAGTVDAPFATVQRAIDAMRASSEKQTHVRGGLYAQSGVTLALDARDDGIELLGYPGETPVVSGGFAVAGWTLIDATHGIWSAPLPAGLTSVGAVTVDGAWFDVARTPNRVPGDPQAHASWLFVEQSLGPVVDPGTPSFSTDNAFTYRNDDFDPAMGIDAEPDAWVSIWDKLGWSEDILQISSIDYTAHAVHLDAASQFGLAANSRYFIYGVRSALDAPGEYYVDIANQQLLVIPLGGKDPNTSAVVASGFNGPPIISIDGADSIHIAGLELRDQHNTGRYGVVAGGGVKILSGTNMQIDHDAFHALGVGVDIEAGTGHVVAANAIYDIACNGIYMAGDQNTITGNTIHDVGLIEQGSSGVVVGPGRNVIAHNHISYVPHHGINEVGDMANGLIVEYNVLDHVNFGANDAGAIYLKNRGNYNPAAREQVRYNEITGTGGLEVADDGAFTQPGFTFALYLDDGQSGTDVYGNLIVGASAGSVFPHNGTDNHIYDNVIVDGGAEQLFIESSTNPTGNLFEANLFVSSALEPTIYVKYEGEEATLHNNLFYNPAMPSYFDQVFFAYSDGTTLTFAAAQTAGFHVGSVVADPLFTDPIDGDYRLQPGSPAFALGFQELPYGQFGP